jgi:hypothetical protein
MGLFKPDFFRALIVGFLIGTAGMAISISSDAQAASMVAQSHR